MSPKTRREKLEAEGWRRMNLIDEPRLTELAETYRELGYEVHLEPLHPDEEMECTECIAAEPERYRTIYVRMPAGDSEPS
jgi:signal recognition particle subunit SEC65